MTSFHVDLQTTCKGLKTTVEEYQKIKQAIVSKEQDTV